MMSASERTIPPVVREAIIAQAENRTEEDVDVARAVRAPFGGPRGDSDECDLISPNFLRVIGGRGGWIGVGSGGMKRKAAVASIERRMHYQANRPSWSRARGV